jgi:hypothetical protein
MVIPFRLLAGCLGEAMTESSQVVSCRDTRLLTELRWALKGIGIRFKWAQQCLVQAMAAQWMLQRRGFTSTLYLGVRKDDYDALSAHAWLRTGPDILVGAENQPEFRVVALFGNRS